MLMVYSVVKKEYLEFDKYVPWFERAMEETYFDIMNKKGLPNITELCDKISSEYYYKFAVFAIEEKKGIKYMDSELKKEIFDDEKDYWEGTPEQASIVEDIIKYLVFNKLAFRDVNADVDAYKEYTDRVIAIRSVVNLGIIYYDIIVNSAQMTWSDIREQRV